MSSRPLCFALSPDGRTRTADGQPVDCESLHTEVIAPAVDAAGLELVRIKDAPPVDSLVDRLSLFGFGIVQVCALTSPTLVAVGRWEALRGTRAVLLDVAGTRAEACRGLEVLVGNVDPEGQPVDGAALRALIVQALSGQGARVAPPSLYSLLDGVPPAHPERYKTDLFRARVHSPPPWGSALEEARRSGVEAVRAVEARLGPLAAVAPVTAIDLLLSYRAVSGWQELVDLASGLEPALARTAMVREQHAMALNRLGRGDDAEALLLAVIAERGPSSETFGLLGRTYKDRWDQARPGAPADASRWLGLATDAYTAGFDADIRDVYPGLNAVTLMELQDRPDPRGAQLLPIIDYVLQQRTAKGALDYWDHATALEVAVLRRDEERAVLALASALTALREPWEARTSARNLRLIDEARIRRGDGDAWLRPLIEKLEAARPHRGEESKA